MRAALPLALLLASCGQQGPTKEPPAANQSAEINALAADLDQMESDVRLRRLEERMGALEAQLGNATLRDADVDDLDRRMRALEAGAAVTAKPPATSATPAP
ncbi:MAG: hypothetical protein EOP62_07365 [Sphingomonadales bacterium]|nr:MAG: hypothetical protein EOP62_07365 [Sphingomonadales bacterium]